MMRSWWASYERVATHVKCLRSALEPPRRLVEISSARRISSHGEFEAERAGGGLNFAPL